MKVMVACEFSGRVRDAFLRAGHDAITFTGIAAAMADQWGTQKPR